nr:immunoglobulin heavy chain junction region [Mus musculus]
CARGGIYDGYHFDYW